VTSVGETGRAHRFGIRGAGHDYSGVVVLRGVDFEMRSGDVHALVGENGCGKSTLIKILTGALQPRAGQMYLDDETLRFSSPSDAQDRAIGVVHQNYNLFADLTVAQNVVGVTKTLPRRLLGSIDHRALDRRVRHLFEQLEIDIPTGELVGGLDPAERKFVEIARAMNVEPRFLILDEPTASLEPNSAKRVLALLARLRSQGVGLAFVTHRLDEVLRIADQVTVLRDGALITNVPNQGLTEEKLVEFIIGHEQEQPAAREAQEFGAPVLRVRGVRLAPDTPPVELELRRGEVLGLTGLLGSGAAEIVRMVGGAVPLPGTIEVEGRPARISTPHAASRLGIGFIPEDRKSVGLVLDHTVATNISLASLDQVSSRGGVVSHRRIAERAEDYRGRLDIRMPAVDAPVRTLSGGNQQKVMIAKWLASGVRIMAVEEPTQGVDVGGKAQIHALLREFARAGGSIIVASTDVREVLVLCDRIAIFRHGAVTSVLETTQLTHSQLAVRGVSDPEEILSGLVNTDEEAVSLP
jgi:ABC-type sugar transport system ATPase subunit